MNLSFLPGMAKDKKNKHPDQEKENEEQNEERES